MLFKRCNIYDVNKRKFINSTNLLHNIPQLKCRYFKNYDWFKLLFSFRLIRCPFRLEFRSHETECFLNGFIRADMLQDIWKVCSDILYAIT